MLSIDQQLRYARHLCLPAFGPEAQERLLESSVLMIGAGGLGSPAAFYLAAAGVGRLGIVDDDIVDLTNLQRQILHRNDAVGQAKTLSAQDELLARNPDIEVIPYQERLTAGNARALLKQYDLVLDGADNFPARYLINDAAFLEGKPVVHGSVYLYEGQVMVLAPPRGPCYRCLFPSPPAPGTVPSCAEAGVLGVLPGVIGVLQATEAIKLLTGLGESLTGRILAYDAMQMTFQSFHVHRRHDCPLCGESPTITEVQEIEWHCPLADPGILALEVKHYRQLRDTETPHLLLDVRQASELRGGAIAGAMNIPLDEVDKRIAEISDWRDKLVVCLCQSGVRSAKAAAALREHGFSRVANLTGGYLAWLRSE